MKDEDVKRYIGFLSTFAEKCKERADEIKEEEEEETVKDGAKDELRAGK